MKRGIQRGGRKREAGMKRGIQRGGRKKRGRDKERDPERRRKKEIYGKCSNCAIIVIVVTYNSTSKTKIALSMKTPLKTLRTSLRLLYSFHLLYLPKVVSTI